MWFLKRFKKKQEFISVIPSNGVIGIKSCKINGLWWGPYISDFLMINWLIDLIAMHDWFILFLNMRISICTYPLFTDPASWYRICHWRSRYALILILIILYACSYFHMCKFDLSIRWFPHWSPRQLQSISRDPTLGT